MFIPGGPDNLKLRRIPIISYGYIVLLITGFIFTSIKEQRSLRNDIALAAYLKNGSSELTQDPLFLDLVNRFPKYCFETIIMVPNDRHDQALQTYLDGKTKIALDRYKSSPYVKFGITIKTLYSSTF